MNAELTSIKTAAKAVAAPGTSLPVGALEPQPIVQAVVRTKPVVAKGSWKMYMNSEYWLSLVGGKDGLTVMAAWFATGLVTGYLVKRYLRFVILVLLGVVTVVAVGEYCGFVTFHWNMVRDFFHAQSADGLSGFGAQLYVDFKAHALWYVSGLIGFLLGHMVG